MTTKRELCRIIILCAVFLSLLWYAALVECIAHEVERSEDSQDPLELPGDTLTMAVVYMTFAPVASEEIDSTLVDYWDDFETLMFSHMATMSYDIHQVTVRTIRRPGGDSCPFH